LSPLPSKLLRAAGFGTIVKRLALGLNPATLVSVDEESLLIHLIRKRGDRAKMWPEGNINVKISVVPVLDHFPGWDNAVGNTGSPIVPHENSPTMFCPPEYVSRVFVRAARIFGLRLVFVFANCCQNSVRPLPKTRRSGHVAICRDKGCRIPART